MDGIELISFEIISTVGAARSSYIHAIHLARQKKFQEALAQIEEGNQQFKKGHQAHAKLIQEEAAGKHPTISLLLIHAEDQLMAAETFKLLCEEFIHIYTELQANSVN